MIAGVVVNESQPDEESNNVIIDANYEERDTKRNETQNPMDFAANIEKVKEVNLLRLNQNVRRYHLLIE